MERQLAGYVAKNPRTTLKNQTNDLTVWNRGIEKDSCDGSRPKWTMWLQTTRDSTIDHDHNNCFSCCS